ncbi:hypothetical protein H6G25_03665 [Dolichospermum sp. FACHB-1091]|uniref:hypothetical protein n=1 Tax=Dolichospermum sp. FACHB-1091 TaxID=2692798 RepID=UPI00168024DB|nr:hypothetical protein [Dolichospermum sp. FACHB-1091]MBD2442314.1 hypothetical protein [Dolichospermum sp. FACHB-1091]
MGAWEDIQSVNNALYQHAQATNRYIVAEPHKWWIKVSQQHLLNFIDGPLTPEKATAFMRQFNHRINFHRSDETVNGRCISPPSSVFKSYEQMPVYTFVIESY